MPIYEYTCPQCEKMVEKIQGVNDPVPHCEECLTEMSRNISLSSFRLKGGGWYRDGYTKVPKDKK